MDLPCWSKMFCGKHWLLVLSLHAVVVVVIGLSFCSGTVRDFASITKFWNAEGSLGPMLVMELYG